MSNNILGCWIIGSVYKKVFLTHRSEWRLIFSAQRYDGAQGRLLYFLFVFWFVTRRALELLTVLAYSDQHRGKMRDAGVSSPLLNSEVVKKTWNSQVRLTRWPFLQVKARQDKTRLDYRENMIRYGRWYNQGSTTHITVILAHAFHPDQEPEIRHSRFLQTTDM